MLQRLTAINDYLTRIYGTLTADTICDTMQFYTDIMRSSI